MCDRPNTHSPASLYAEDSCDEEKRISESPSDDENYRDANFMDPSSTTRSASPTGSVPSLHHPHHLPANGTTVEKNETSSSLAAAKDFLPNDGSSLQTTLFNVILRSPSISVIFAADTPPAATPPAASSPTTALLQSVAVPCSPQHSTPSATIDKVRHDTPTVVWQGGGGASISGTPQTPPGSNPTLACSRRSSVDAAAACAVPSDNDVPSVTPKPHPEAVNTRHTTRQQEAGSMYPASVLPQKQQTTTTTHACGGQWTPEPIPSQQQPQFPAAAGRGRSGSSWLNSSFHTVDENLPTIRLSLQHSKPNELDATAGYADLDEQSIGANASQQPTLPTVKNRRTFSPSCCHALHQKATMELPSPPPLTLAVDQDLATMIPSSHIVASASVSCFATTTTDNEEDPPVFFGGDEGSIADEASPPRRCSASQRSYWSQHFDDENHEVRQEKENHNENLHARNEDDDNVIYLSQNSSRQPRSSVSSRASDEGDDSGKVIEFAGSTVSIDEEPLCADTTAVLPTLSSLLMDAAEDDSDSWSDVKSDHHSSNLLPSLSTSRASPQARNAEKEGVTSPSPPPLAPQLVVGRAVSAEMHVVVAAGNPNAVVRVAQRSQEPVLRRIPSQKGIMEMQQTRVPGPPAATRRGAVVQQQQQPNHSERTKHLKRCPHADAPDRLRLVPSLTCAACAYSVCCHCFARSDAAALLLSPGTDSAESSHENNSFELLLQDPQQRFNVVISHLQERFGGGGGFTAAAQQQPLRCHVCKQPHSALTYDDVAPFPWSCEGMHPIHRVSLKGGGMYAQAAVQKYYQIRSIRDAREKVPLTELSVTWIGRSVDNDNYNDSSDTRAKLSQPMRSSSRDAFRDHAAGLFSTVRVGSCPVARERYRSAESQHQLLPAAAEHRGGDPQQRCDLRRGHCVVEGSSFYVTLRNPSRGTKLLWCARSGVPRGEVLFHASDDIGHHPANNSLYHHNAPGDGKAKGRGLPTSTTNNLSSTMNCLLSHSGSSSTVGALIPVALWSAPPTVDGVVVDTAATAAATTYSSSRGGTAGGGRSAPALVSVPPWVFEVTIPHGFWEETGGCGTLELYHYTSSSSHEVFYHPQKNGGNGMEESGGAGVGGESSTSSAQLTSAQQHGMSHLSGKQRYLDGAASASPLLVVEVLHERVVDTSAPPNTTSRTTVSSQYPPPYPPEANFMLDALHHGRHVGVYGVGSKHAFLTHVSRSHLFSETRVHCIDIGSAGAAHRVGGVTTTSGRLYDELQRVEHEILTAQRVVRRREAALQRRRGSVAATNNVASFRHQEGRLKEWKHQTDSNERAVLLNAQHVIVDLTNDAVDDAVEDSPHTTQAGLQPLQYTQNASCLTPMATTPSSQQHVASQGGRDKNRSGVVLSPPPRFAWEESGGSSQNPTTTTTTTATVQKPRLDIYGGDDNPQHNRKRAREIDDNDAAAMNNNSGLQADLSRSYGLQRTVFSEPPQQRSFSSDGSQRESAGFDVRKTSVVDGRFPFAIPPALLRAAQTLSAPFSCQPLLLLRPSYSESSSKSSRRLAAGGSSLGDLIVIFGIDRILQLGIGGNSSSSVATNAAGSNNKLPWIQEFSAMLQRVTSPSAGGASSAVGLIFSFDDPEFLVNVPRDFLHAVRPLIVQLQSPTWLLPRTGELADAHWSAPRRATVPLLHALSAAIGNSGVTGGGAAGGGGNAAGANRRRGLPLVDTVRRVILSLPEAFRQLLQLTVKKQREAGEDVFIAVPLLLEFFLSEANLFVSQGRMRPFLQELTSNRIAVYEASRHAVMILQHHLVSQVLDDVLLKGNGGTP